MFLEIPDCVLQSMTSEPQQDTTHALTGTASPCAATNASAAYATAESLHWYGQYLRPC